MQHGQQEQQYRCIFVPKIRTKWSLPVGELRPQQSATLLGILILASWGALERFFQTSLLVRPSMLVFARELFARSAPTSAWFVDLSSQCDQAYISTLTGTAPVPMRSCVSGGLVPLDAGPSKLSPSSSPAPGLITTAAWSSRLDCRLPSDQACASTPYMVG
ncbi:hypothetical protein CMEL01_01349 [Colletotrichum melonis]|uniref:Uncharacterized protein n=2 Tax=Colletotrichum acutatum species complex TaxID=2707335 RepID=A0AAI9V6B9_9PEZI|nr:hypothetical protein CLIM01_09974 [Colletotrichum limetticola]KAK1469582.1 hypothetical protein CMEL01_01349 [Colletotrichum melonis]